MAVNTILLPCKSRDTLRIAVDMLLRGQPVAFPTDTVYGIGVHALCTDAVHNLYRVKARPESKAIPVLISGVSDLERVACDLPAVVYRLTAALWPGALTIVVRRRSIISKEVSAGGSTVAVRVPGHPFVLDLLREVGVPLATSSANLSGHPAPVTAGEVLQQLNGRVPIVVDGGPCPGGVPSTVIDVSAEPFRIVRQGAVSRERLASIVPNTVFVVDGDEG